MLSQLYFFIFTFISKQHRLNQQIKAPIVRLIDEDENQLGEKPIGEALQLAEEAGVDLVEVAPLAKPPVCKILDYGKYLYRQKKNEQKHRKMQKKTELKVIRLTLRIDEHDIKVKAKNAEKFLKQKNSVKVMLMLKGREAAMADMGIQKVKDFYERIKEHAAIESEPRRQGNNISMILIPQK
ncbi:translation initiation factor IF-3 [Candidatus Peregrinibacteria bacterium]|nr:translation initiation factor IF-3 [Candidatus Peregrinibacteria bacterium]